MKWNHVSQLKPENRSPSEIVATLLKNRGLVTKKDVTAFLVPKSPDTLESKDVGISPKDFVKALARVNSAIKNSEPIVVYGDYDADGICATAIMWEALRELGANVKPFIPLREKEGYGLSSDGIDSIINSPDYHVAEGKGLIITVDSGIVAFEAVDYANKRGLDVIIIDHHEKADRLPAAYSLIHTNQLCASGIAWFFAKSFSDNPDRLNSWLELASIATVADLVPLLGPNRSIVKAGLPLLNNTSRMGLRALYSLAGIQKVGTYEIGFLIGPRLNASGRLESAMTALQMLCTSDFNEALEQAKLLNETNRERQTMTEEMTLHALEGLGAKGSELKKIIVIDDDSYHQGVIGLIAGKLVEKYYLPAIVIARGESISRASARSIMGFNIIEAIREANDFLLGAGGHPMAAGFSIKTTQIEAFREKIIHVAEQAITLDLLERSLRVDMVLDPSAVSMDLWKKLQQFAPFGIGNPEPTFSSTVTVRDSRTVGSEGKHLKLRVGLPAGPAGILDIDCIAFGKGGICQQLPVGTEIGIAYTIDNNIFNGRENLQLKIKDIQIGRAP